MFQCTSCNKRFTRAVNLQHHKNNSDICRESVSADDHIASKNTHFECMTCHQMFTRGWDLQRHQQDSKYCSDIPTNAAASDDTSTDQDSDIFVDANPQHECTICCHSFSRLRNLRRHQRNSERCISHSSQEQHLDDSSISQQSSDSAKYILMDKGFISVLASKNILQVL